MLYFVHAEDLAAVVVGPFNSEAEAVAHVAFCKARGDSAVTEVFAASSLAFVERHIEAELVSPEEDRAFAPND